MRLLLIEKKAAAKYGDGGDGAVDGNAASRQEQDAEVEEHEDTEEDPLIKKQQKDDYKIAPDLPGPVRSFPILYC